ncbi:MAG TPA: PEP-CTERM sorting domain-containing protein [Methylophilaceae bacterium]|nr:PEP-CTERM sorting domain-containing protein [Methylophilaceae bacterium]
MKKITTMLALLALSTVAHANGYATSSLSNFSFTVLSGNTTIPDLSLLGVNINAFILDDFVTPVSDYSFSYGSPINTSLTLSDGGTTSTGTANSTNTSLNIFSSSISSGGYAQSSVTSDFFFDYKANSLLLISATATVTGGGSVTNGVQADSTASMNLYSNSFDLGFSGTSVNTYLGSSNVFSDPYSVTKTIKFYFYDDMDSSLQFNATVNSSVAVPTVSAVPEPDAYTMLLAGLTLMGFVARRKNS